MGLFSFIKDAGEKLFGGSKSNDEKAGAIKAHLEKFQFPTTGIEISVDDEKVTLKGELASAETKKKMLATAGNVEGIEEVIDELVVADFDLGADAFYTVKSGDTLWKIAEETLGNGADYKKIFEANTPAPLIDADKIYPGQVLVIPS